MNGIATLVKRAVTGWIVIVSSCWAAGDAKTLPAKEPVTPALMTIPVDSPAFVFSPANWVGDEGRGGKKFRQTWNTGAYFKVAWSSANANPTARITLDTSGYPSKGFGPPKISYNIDGIWKINVVCSQDIVVQDVDPKRQTHELTVLLSFSNQSARWGAEGVSGTNVLRVTGVQVDEGSQPVPASPRNKWGLIVGDSITEGVGTGPLNSYSHLLGQALATRGYDYAISACGWSGWLARGDNPPGDVPAYYCVTNSQDGTGGTYKDGYSRWNKIDGNGHSLLDAKGRLSAHGQTNQEPEFILINYCTNDGKKNPSDLKASINQCLAALRNSAPEAHIMVLVPFGQYGVQLLKQAVESRQQANPPDSRIHLIDLGPDVARSLTAKEKPYGDLHPNDRGAANFAALLIPHVLTILDK